MDSIQLPSSTAKDDAVDAAATDSDNESWEIMDVDRDDVLTKAAKAAAAVATVNVVGSAAEEVVDEVSDAEEASDEEEEEEEEDDEAEPAEKKTAEETMDRLKYVFDFVGNVRSETENPAQAAQNQDDNNRTALATKSAAANPETGAVVEALKHTLDTFRPGRYIVEHSGSFAVAVVALLVMCYTISSFGPQRIPSRLHKLEQKVRQLEADVERLPLDEDYRETIAQVLRELEAKQQELAAFSAGPQTYGKAERDNNAPRKAAPHHVGEPEPSAPRYEKPKKTYVKEHEDERKEYKKYENRGRKEYKKYEQKYEQKQHHQEGQDQHHAKQRGFDSDEVDNRAHHRKIKPYAQQRVDRVQKDYRH